MTLLFFLVSSGLSLGIPIVFLIASLYRIQWGDFLELALVGALYPIAITIPNEKMTFFLLLTASAAYLFFRNLLLFFSFKAENTSSILVWKAGIKAVCALVFPGAFLVMYLIGQMWASC